MSLQYWTWLLQQSLKLLPRIYPKGFGENDDFDYREKFLSFTEKFYHNYHETNNTI